MTESSFREQLDMLSVSTCSPISSDIETDELDDLSSAYSFSTSTSTSIATAVPPASPAPAPKVVLVGKLSDEEGLMRDETTIFLQCAMSTDEDGLVEGVSHSSLNEEVDENAEGSTLKFSLKAVDFVFHSQAKTFFDEKQTRYTKPVILVRAVARQPNVEWRYLVQMRILTADAKSVVRVVDSDLFEFGGRISPPLIIDVNDPMVCKLKLEIRYIHQMYEEMPTFQKDGDTILKFSDETSVFTYKSLLALHSPKLALALKTAAVSVEGLTELEISECDSAAFRELLCQLYPTQRPIYADFRALCRAALAFSTRIVLNALVSHLVGYQHFDFIRKIHEAYKLGLNEAITELVYNAVKAGIWGHIINLGFDPKAEFHEDVYLRYIYPAVLSATSTPGTDAYRRPLTIVLNFTDPRLAGDPHSVCFRVNAQTFYVNRGVLAVHNDSMFGRGNNGELYPHVTVEMRNELDYANLKLTDLMEPLFCHLYGQPNALRMEYVRPLIVFASVHKMTHLLQSLEELLVQEPPITPECLLNHLKFADVYNLNNLLRVTVFRMEGSYKEVADTLIHMPEFEAVLSRRVQLLVTDRLCCGWAAWGVEWAKKSVPTVLRQRRVTTETGGATLGSNYGDDHLATLNIVDSDYMFGPLNNDENIGNAATQLKTQSLQQSADYKAEAAADEFQRSMAALSLANAEKEETSSQACKMCGSVLRV